MVYIESDSPGDAINKVLEACARADVVNLTVNFPMTLPASSTGVLAAYRGDAADWQARDRPNSLLFNHGEYMHAHGDPMNYLIEHLRQKQTSNRACIVLVDSGPIVSSGDGPLPSFMLVQVGFQGAAQDVLYVTAYYRALEVTSFLPLNITELALIAETIADGIPAINRAVVTIHAFRAHAQAGFRAHQRAQLDMDTADEIRALVQNRSLREISERLREKSAPASIIEDSGLTTLHLEVEQAGWSDELLNELGHALGALTRLRSVRTVGTHGEWIEKIQAQVTDHLLKAAELVESSK